MDTWIPLAAIPASGREFSFEEDSFWLSNWKASGYLFDIKKPLQARLYILPQNDGFFIQGDLQGLLSGVCDRCTETAPISIEHHFERFEALEDSQTSEGEDSALRLGEAGWELHLAGLLWEEFLLGLPEKILCAETCLGLCPHCGKNKNTESCLCNLDTTTSPLATALQGFRTKNS